MSFPCEVMRTRKWYVMLCCRDKIFDSARQWAFPWAPFFFLHFLPSSFQLERDGAREIWKAVKTMSWNRRHLPARKVLRFQLVDVLSTRNKSPQTSNACKRPEKLYMCMCNSPISSRREQLTRKLKSQSPSMLQVKAQTRRDYSVVDFYWRCRDDLHRWFAFKWKRARRARSPLSLALVAEYRDNCPTVILLVHLHVPLRVDTKCIQFRSKYDSSPTNASLQVHFGKSGICIMVLRFLDGLEKCASFCRFFHRCKLAMLVWWDLPPVTCGSLLMVFRHGSLWILWCRVSVSQIFPYWLDPQ